MQDTASNHFRSANAGGGAGGLLLQPATSSSKVKPTVGWKRNILGRRRNQEVSGWDVEWKGFISAALACAPFLLPYSSWTLQPSKMYGIDPSGPIGAAEA